MLRCLTFDRNIEDVESSPARGEIHPSDVVQSIGIYLYRSLLLAALCALEFLRSYVKYLLKKILHSASPGAMDAGVADAKIGDGSSVAPMGPAT